MRAKPVTIHHFTKGDVVAVLNRKYSGEFIVEGKATVLRRRPGVDDQYLVRFHRDGKPSAEEDYERFVDPAAQADPEAYVRAVNAKMNAKVTA